jgi:hypothetical protein
MMQNRLEGMWLGKSIGGTLGLPYEGWLEPPDLEFYDPVPLEPPPNDDVELQMVWLHLLEQRGLRLGQKDFAEGWIRHIHYMWDEYGRCRWNLATGIPATNCGTHGNPFHAGMGSPIRSEIWASLYPGQPELAATYARLDASLDHGDEGTFLGIGAFGPGRRWKCLKPCGAFARRVPLMSNGWPRRQRSPT